MSYSTSSWVPMYAILFFFFILLCPTEASNWNSVFAVFLFFSLLWFHLTSVWVVCSVWFLFSYSLFHCVNYYSFYCLLRSSDWLFSFFIFLLNIHVFWGCWLKLPLGWCCGLLFIGFDSQGAILIYDYACCSALYCFRRYYVDSGQ